MDYFHGEELLLIYDVFTLSYIFVRQEKYTRYSFPLLASVLCACVCVCLNNLLPYYPSKKIIEGSF